MPAEHFTLPTARPQVAVVGDVMIDDNMYLEFTGKDDIVADRASLLQQASGLGGAGNVAASTAGLGNHTALVGMVGDDAHGTRLQNATRTRGNLYQMLFVADGVKTPRKLRLYDRHTLRTRVDDEGRAVSYYDTRRSRAPFKTTPTAVCEWLAANGLRVICTVDHAKGFFLDGTSDEFPASVFQRRLRELGLPLICDPKPNRNWPHIPGDKVVLKMNHLQLHDVVGKAIGREWVIPSYLSPSDARNHFNTVRADILRSKAIHCDWLWLTYGKSGMSIGPMSAEWSAFVGGNPDQTPVDVENIRLDATGCGDTCTAVMAHFVANRGYTPETILDGFVHANYAAMLASRCLGCHVMTRHLFEEVERGVAKTEDRSRIMAHVA